MWASDLAGEGTLAFARLPEYIFARSEDEDDEEEEEETGVWKDLFLPSPKGSVRQLDQDELMASSSPTPLIHSKAAMGPARTTIESDEMEVEEFTSGYRPKTVKMADRAGRVAGVSKGIITKKGPSETEVNTSGKRSRPSGEPAAPKRVKITNGRTDVGGLDRYEESDYEEDRERNPDLLRESLEEKTMAFERRHDRINLKGVRVPDLSRIRLSTVPGLLSKVRFEFFWDPEDVLLTWFSEMRVLHYCFQKEALHSFMGGQRHQSDDLLCGLPVRQEDLHTFGGARPCHADHHTFVGRSLEGQERGICDAWR